MSSTQPNPRVITGTSAELANFTPSLMTGGTFFFAKDVLPDGQLYVLEINGSVRSWKPIGSGGSVPPLEYTVFVGKNGNDGTADGSIGKPFLTVQAAMEFAYTTYVVPAGPQPSPPFLRPCVFVSAGTYIEPTLTLPPQICVMGEGYNHSRIQGNWTIDGRWSNVPGPNDFRSTWLNVGVFGDVTVDFGVVDSNEGKLYAMGCRFTGVFTISQKTVNPSSNQMILTACEFLGGMALGGIPTTMIGCWVPSALILTQLIGTGVDNIFESSGGSFNDITVITTVVAAPYQCRFGHSAQDGAKLTLDGAFSSVKADISALPLQSNITLMNGAILNQITRINQSNFSGGAADRPASPYTGQQFFATELLPARPIWWDGLAWIDAAGTPV